jgi:hypothetical protein
LDIHVYWNILTMYGPINVKSPNNTSKWQMGFNSAFKGLRNIGIINSTTRLHLVGYFYTIYNLPLACMGLKCGCSYYGKNTD